MGVNCVNPAYCIGLSIAEEPKETEIRTVRYSTVREGTSWSVYCLTYSRLVAAQYVRPCYYSMTHTSLVGFGRTLQSYHKILGWHATRTIRSPLYRYPASASSSSAEGNNSVI